MNFACLLLLSFTMSDAPKPVPADGRIRFWADGVFVDMKQDGSDIKEIAIPEQPRFPRYNLHVSSDLKSTLVIDFLKLNAKIKIHCTVRPLLSDMKEYVLTGFAIRTVYGIAEDKIIFLGAEGDAWDGDTEKNSANWIYDITAKKAEKIKLPDDHILASISSNGKYYVTSSPRIRNAATAITYYLVDAKTLKAKQIFHPGIKLISPISISANGEHVLAEACDYDAVLLTTKQNPKEPDSVNFAVQNIRNRETVVYDVVNRKMKPLKVPLNFEKMQSVLLSPDGRKIAYLESEFIGENPNGRFPKAGTQVRDYNIYVADADGSNAKVIYKTTAGVFRTFQWIEK